MTKYASIYKKASKFYVMPGCITEVGLEVACGDCAVTENDEDLCALLMQALKQSRIGVPHPKDWQEFNNNFFSKFNVRSHAEFQKNMVMITATEDEGVITLLPFNNLGTKRGFEGNSKQATRIEVDSTQELVVEAILKAISLAT